MTDKEKAKAYDMALEIAKNEINIKGIGETVELCERLFPELRESEDERIRKELIEYFNHYSGGDNISVRFPKWIAYLEKQKDASKAIEAVDRIDKYIDKHVANAHDMKDSNPDKKYYRGWDDALGKIAGILQDVYSGKEKQKEQKPAEWSKNDTVFLNEITDFFENKTVRLQHDIDMYAHWLKSLPERFNLQPKEEWSEEDEKIISFYEADYNNQIGDMSMKDVINMRLKFKNWLVNRLKSLRPQPNPEWSEEDKRKLNRIYKILGYAADESIIEDKEAIELQDFLKSLCPSWKPSEEQMATLGQWLKDKQFDGASRYVYPIFESLYNDLKKLIWTR